MVLFDSIHQKLPGKSRHTTWSRVLVLRSPHRRTLTFFHPLALITSFQAHDSFATSSSFKTLHRAVYLWYSAHPPFFKRPSTCSVQPIPPSSIHHSVRPPSKINLTEMSRSWRFTAVPSLTIPEDKREMKDLALYLVDMVEIIETQETAIDQMTCNTRPG